MSIDMATYRPMSVTQSFYHSKLHWPRQEKKRKHFLDFVLRCAGTGYDWDCDGRMRQTEPQVRRTGKKDGDGDYITEWWDHWQWCLPGWVYPIAFWLWYPVYRFVNSKWNQDRRTHKRMLEMLREDGGEYGSLIAFSKKCCWEERWKWWKAKLSFRKPKRTAMQKMWDKLGGRWQPHAMWGNWETDDAKMDVVDTEYYNSNWNKFDAMPDNVTEDWLAAAHECLDTVINGKWRRTYFNPTKKGDKPTVHFQPIKEKKYARKLKKRLEKRFVQPKGAA